MSDDDVDVIVENLGRILPILSKFTMRGIRSKTNLAPQVIHVMGALVYHGKLTMTGIGNHLSLPKPQITTLIDKLVKSNYAERLNDENDRRIIYIQMTPKGTKKYGEIKRYVKDAIKAALEDLDQKSLTDLKNGSTLVRDVLVELINKQPGTCQNLNPKINQ